MSCSLGRAAPSTRTQRRAKREKAQNEARARLRAAFRALTCSLGHVAVLQLPGVDGERVQALAERVGGLGVVGAAVDVEAVDPGPLGARRPLLLRGRRLGGVGPGARLGSRLRFAFLLLVLRDQATTTQKGGEDVQLNS